MSRHFSSVPVSEAPGDSSRRWPGGDAALGHDCRPRCGGARTIPSRYPRRSHSLMFCGPSPDPLEADSGVTDSGASWSRDVERGRGEGETWATGGCRFDDGGHQLTKLRLE